MVHSATRTVCGGGVQADIMTCQTCGACCVNDQLILVRPEDDVPHTLISGGALIRVAGRCIAFEGRVGKSCRCTIYDQRPVICRTLAVGSWACIEVRQACGLFGRPTCD